MTDNYLGEIRMFSFEYAPAGWALCNGAKMNIAQNQALYSLIVNTYGGDGKTYFNLPDLQGRVPRQYGRDSTGIVYQFGKTGGAETVVLTAATTPAHNHTINATTTVGTLGNPAGAYLGAAPTVPGATVAPLLYGQQPTVPTQQTPLNTSVLGIAGSSAGHSNMQPFAVLNFCIAISGLYPTRD